MKLMKKKISIKLLRNGEKYLEMNLERFKKLSQALVLLGEFNHKNIRKNLLMNSIQKN